VAITDKIFKERRQKKIKAMAYKTLFNLEDPTARIVLNDMCEAHGVFDGGFDPDPYLNAESSGERNVVLRILTICKMSLNDIIGLSEEEDK